MRHYALKILRAGQRPSWITGLTIAEALEKSSQLIYAEEGILSQGDVEPRYLTATIYRDAKVVSLCRYFPPAMRKGERSVSPPSAQQRS